MLKAFIDSNVLLDVFLKREPFYKNSLLVCNLAQLAYISATITSSSLTDIYYILQREVDKKTAKGEVREIVEDFDLIHIDKNCVIRALESDFTDLEDGMQNFAAKTAGCTVIVTRNMKDFKHSLLDVKTLMSSSSAI